MQFGQGGMSSGGLSTGGLHSGPSTGGLNTGGTNTGGMIGGAGPATAGFGVPGFTPRAPARAADAGPAKSWGCAPGGFLGLARLARLGLLWGLSAFVAAELRRQPIALPSAIFPPAEMQF